jgi:hypothetical protein
MKQNFSYVILYQYSLVDPDSSINSPTNFIDAYKYVWSDAASKELVNELCIEFINNHRHEFHLGYSLY